MFWTEENFPSNLMSPRDILVSFLIKICQSNTKHAHYIYVLRCAGSTQQTFLHISLSSTSLQIIIFREKFVKLMYFRLKLVKYSLILQECHYLVDKFGVVDFVSPRMGKVSKPVCPNLYEQF